MYTFVLLYYPTAQPTSSHSSQQQSNSPGELSPEYKRLRENFETVVSFLSNNIEPESLAGKLFAKGMISHSIAEKADVRGVTNSERIRPLIYAVISQVDKNTAKYGLFVNILEDEGGLDELVKLLQIQ